jgi:hypothetical protein
MKPNLPKSKNSIFRVYDKNRRRNGEKEREKKRPRGIGRRWRE